MALAGLSVASGAAAADISPNPVAPVQRGPGTVSGDSLPTVQIDSGVVWSQAVTGNTVFAGGKFTQTRPAGAKVGESLTPRSNLLAYDLATGELLPFNPQVNGEVKTVQASPDGTRLYIGGSFTKVNGKDRWEIAAFDIATGELLDSFRPAIGGSFVNAITVSDTHVYVGGRFTQAKGVKRTNLAAFDLDGNLSAWSPVTNNQIDSMVMSPNGSRVILAGRFTTVNAATAHATASVTADSGATAPWAVNKIITGAGNGGGTMGLSTDGKYVYGAGWLQAVWYFEGVWAAEPDTGELVWVADGQGDQYDVFASSSSLYVVGHNHVATPFGGWPDMKTPSGRYQFSMALTKEPMGTGTTGGRGSFAGKPAPGLVHWYPNWISGKATGMGQAGWSVEGNEDYVVVGGEFPGVNGKLQQGLARFATPSVAASTQGPRLSATPNVAADVWEVPSFVAQNGGGRVTIRPNYDRDDRALGYELYRSGTATPVASTTLESDPWLRTSQWVTLVDETAQPNTTYTYTVKAVDPNGNSAMSKPVTGRTSNFAMPLKAVPTATMSGLLGTFDASGSTVAQGSQITSWAWDFGDGATSTEAIAQHTYAAAGTYTVSLTVKDNRGTSATATIDVAADSTIARDTFQRTNGQWGPAEIGGAWSTDKGMPVTDGAGLIPTAKDQTANAWLKAVQAQDVDLTMDFSLAKASEGGGTFLSASVRRTDTGEYRSKLVMNTDGSIAISLTKLVGGKETTLKAGVLPDATYQAGDVYRLRYQAVTGKNGTTELQARVWRADQQEPGTWFVRAVDDDASFQRAGHVGMVSYLSSASTIAPQTANIHQFTVTAP